MPRSLQMAALVVVAAAAWIPESVLGLKYCKPKNIKMKMAVKASMVLESPPPPFWFGFWISGKRYSYRRSSGRLRQRR